ncbi:PREDICTED: homeobox protein knotted-1-like 3 [Camelina sativa]|uniref:Homeobox protein knotted-1-like 3 n=1 Tax=Camelina sativa TaxID=90675 RepID=A0ABM0V9M4_CAMSA|nr:PREDICTED: homeobox protein knotted-1-like 3 [Camelina sativa]
MRSTFASAICFALSDALCAASMFFQREIATTCVCIPPAMKAVMACCEIEQSLQSLTGVSPGEEMGTTMSDDGDEQVESDAKMFDGSLDVLGFCPLVSTESERSLIERVRQELKHELKQGYKEKIVDIREEILRKRRAGKLPGDTTSVLKAWWQ